MAQICIVFRACVENARFDVSATFHQWKPGYSRGGNLFSM